MITAANRPQILAVLFLSALVVCGCDTATSNRLAVSGTVTFEGEAVKDGTILFSPTGDDQFQSNGIIKDGTYQIAAEYGPSPGEYKVFIEGFRATGEQHDAGPLHANEDVDDDTESYLPTQSEMDLRTTISAENAASLDFPIASPAK